MYVRDARSTNDTNFNAPLEWAENVLGLDDYDATQLHTVGARLFGETGPLDYDLEIAYQFGDADRIGSLFRPATFLYGDAGAKFDAWGGDVEVGYKLDVPWSPRLFVGGAYYGGEDNREPSFLEWLNPFDLSSASISFNRLFSTVKYNELLDRNRSMSNFWQVRVGADIHPLEKLTVDAKAGYYSAVDPFNPPASITMGPFRVPLAPNLSFWTDDGASEIGVISELTFKYQYSEELYFRVQWQHLFSGGGVEDGAFVDRNGLGSIMGIDRDDADYIEFDTVLKF
jgi:hypothetical protein